MHVSGSVLDFWTHSWNFKHLINQVSLSTTAGDIDKPINKNFLSTTFNLF